MRENKKFLSLMRRIHYQNHRKKPLASAMGMNAGIFMVDI